MSYHDKNIPGNSQSKTNAQGKTAPPGYHYMPDGSLMADSEMTSAGIFVPKTLSIDPGAAQRAGRARLLGTPPISSALPEGSTNAFHYYTQCGLNGTQAQVHTNCVHYDGSYPSTAWDYSWWSYNPWLNDPSAAAAASTAFYNLYGAPNIGERIELQSVWRGVTACLEYVGSLPYMVFGGLPYNNPNIPRMGVWPAGQISSLNAIHPNCTTCLTGVYIYGCKDPNANNYDPTATIDDGSCTYNIPGCTDPTAVNYNPLATVIFGSNGPPVCCYVAGCMNPLAPNYDPLACVDDGSCTGIGCTDPTAQNYDPTATIDDGSCIATVYGCTDPVALNYYPGANVDDGTCCYTSLVYDPACNCAVCAGAGCTDPLATNYDPLATPDDGSCVYPPPVDPCDDLWTNTPGLVQTCCDWCEENALIPGGLYGPPPPGCYDWMCDCCKPPIIKTLDLDLSDIPAEGESRTFTITGEGDGEVKFKLEVKDKDTGKYYNFVTNLFQTTEDSLEGTVTGGKYSGSITFPAVTGGDDQYDIYLYAKPGTKHAKYSEARFGDNTLDINGSIGSNSLLMQKVIYQYAALTLTLHGFSPNATVSGTITTDTISTGRGQSKAKTPFSFTATTAATAAYRVLKQPVESDVLAFVEPVIGATPVNLPGEDIYPAVSNTDTVNGAVTSGTTVTMDTAVASKMKVGDRVTGNAALSATTATVVSLDSTYAFTLSEAVAIADGLTLSFSNQMNFSWTVNNFANVIQEGMIIVPDTNVTSETSIGTYQDTITIFGDTVDEETIIQHDQPAVSTLGEKPTVAKGLVTVQAGQITFDKQQVLALGGDTLKIGGYGESEILRVHDWEVKFTDLAITLTAPTTAVADREGVINNVSTVSGIGIDSAAVNPTLTTGGGLDGAGDWIMSAVQTLENGVTLTVENTGRVATITGNIEIVRAGTRDRTLRFDVEKLLSNSAP